MHDYAIFTCQAQNHIFTFQFKEDPDDVIEDVADEKSHSSVGAMVRQIVLLGFHCLPCLDYIWSTQLHWIIQILYSTCLDCVQFVLLIVQKFRNKYSLHLRVNCYYCACGIFKQSPL